MVLTLKFKIGHMILKLRILYHTFESRRSANRTTL